MGKKFVLSVTLRPDNTIRIETKNSGFNALEILGILTSKQQDVFKQMQQPTKFIRKAITEDRTELIVYKEDEE